MARNLTAVSPEGVDAPVATTEAAPRKRRSSGKPRTVKPIEVVAFVKFTNSDGSTFELPSGVKVQVDEVTRDLASVVSRVLSGELSGATALKIRVPKASDNADESE